MSLLESADIIKEMAETSKEKSVSDLKALEAELASELESAAVVKPEAPKVVAPSRFQRFFSTFKRGPNRLSMGQVFKEMARGLVAKDRETRRMSLLFFVSLGGVIAVMGFGYYRYQLFKQHADGRLSESQMTSKTIGEFMQKQSEQAKQKYNTITIGKFIVSLKPVEGGPRPAPGVSNMAEIEVVVECGSRETRFYIQDHQDAVQDQIAGVLAGIERDELLTKDGKRKLKKKLIDKLNNWLPYGRIDDMYFSSLVIS